MCDLQAKIPLPSWISETLPNFERSDEKLLAQLETHMEMVVVAFAFILEDFGELFIEYFCVEKYITGYEYELEYAQSYMAAVSSISLNLIALLCFIGFVNRFKFVVKTWIWQLSTHSTI